MSDPILKENKDIDNDNKDSESQDTPDESDSSNVSKPQQDHNTGNDPIITPNQNLDSSTQHRLTHTANCDPNSTTLGIALQIAATEAGNGVLRQNLAKSERVNVAMSAQVEAAREVKKASEQANEAGRDLLMARRDYLVLLEQETALLLAGLDARAGAGCIVL